MQQMKTLVSQNPFIMQCQDGCWPEHVGTADGDDQGSCYHMFVVHVLCLDVCGIALRLYRCVVRVQKCACRNALCVHACMQVR
jgi:hypothetical protein